MPDYPIEVLKANIVFVGIALLDSQQSIDNFKRKVDAEVVTVPSLVSGDSPSGDLAVPTLRIDRDRLQIQLGSTRAIISTDYPDRDRFFSLADIAENAISSSGLGDPALSAYGFNVEFICEPRSESAAHQYLARRLHSEGFVGPRNLPLIGATAKLTFADAGDRWNVGVEPRFNDKQTTRMFVSVNLHRDSSGLPENAQLHECLDKVWDMINTLPRWLAESK